MMNSKSILILGIVLIFLLNVIAIHNYINEHYYIRNTKIKPIEIKDKKDINTVVNSTTKKENKKDQENKKKESNLYFKKYKEYYIIEMKNSQKELDEILKKIIEQEKKNMSIEKTKESNENNESSILPSQNIQEDSIDKNAIISFIIDINYPLSEKNQELLNIASKIDDNKKVVIKIYQYSAKISSYLKQIKDKLVDKGVDIDDIEVIYKKNIDLKNQIKVLLIKKDIL